MFQFQCGAIVSSSGLIVEQPLNLFQFQCGAIVSMVDGIYTLQDACFNSSVVRLLERGWESVIHFFKFQFQCGAIVSQWDEMKYSLRSRFNSSVVRLLERSLTPLTFYTSMFQFQCGAIVSDRANQLSNIRTSFNSSVVRLLVDNACKSLVNYSVSIPVWCDC